MARATEDSKGSDSDGIERVEEWVRSVERFMVVLAVAIILLVLSYNVAEKAGYGIDALIIGIGLIVVLVLIEFLLIERQRHQQA